MEKQETLKDKLLNIMESRARECLREILGRESSEEELNIFFNIMYNNALKWDREYYSKVFTNINFYLTRTKTKDFYMAESSCLSFVKEMCRELKIIRYRQYLKQMLRREPTAEELSIYVKNRDFLRSNEPAVNEPDCRVVFRAQASLDFYLRNKEKAFNEAKARYDSLSIMEKFKSGNLFAPRWYEIEEDLGINEEFLNTLYR